MTPLLHDMYRDFHTRLAAEFGDPALASSFELAEADARTAFPLGDSPGGNLGVNGLPGGADVGTAGNGRQADVRSSTRRSMMEGLRIMERGGQEGQLARRNHAHRKDYLAEPIPTLHATGQTLLGDGLGLSQKPVPTEGAVEDRDGSSVSEGQRRQGSTVPFSSRPLSARTRRHLMTSPADVARQSTDSVLSQRDNRDGPPANAALQRSLSASMSVESSTEFFARPGFPGAPGQGAGQSVRRESGHGPGGWQGKPGSVSQSLSFTISGGEGSESRPMTGNGKRPPRMPLLQVGLNLMKVGAEGGAKVRGEEGGMEKSPSPKVGTIPCNCASVYH